MLSPQAAEPLQARSPTRPELRLQAKSPWQPSFAIAPLLWEQASSPMQAPEPRAPVFSSQAKRPTQEGNRAARRTDSGNRKAVMRPSNAMMTLENRVDIRASSHSAWRAEAQCGPGL